MSSPSQARAVRNYRTRLSQRGMMRFEVVGLEKDRELLRTLARRLAEETPEAERMRTEIKQDVSVQQGTKGGIWAWLRTSPLVGAELNLTRPFEPGRKIDL
jgi:hypothetical protein